MRTATGRPGGALAFIWNDDGTLVDVNTQLMWERLDRSGGIHDRDHAFTWVQGLREKIFWLNNTCKSDETVDCSANGDEDCEEALGTDEVCGFAGYRDWRMPNAKEAITIVDYGTWGTNPVAFDWMCGEGCTAIGPDGDACSCPGLGGMWTSTTYRREPDHAYYLSAGAIWFGSLTLPSCEVNRDKVLDVYLVRGVRGGL